MDFRIAAIVNVIRYMPDAEAEAYLRAVLESMPPHRLERAIEIAQEVQKSKAVPA